MLAQHAMVIDYLDFDTDVNEVLKDVHNEVTAKGKTIVVLKAKQVRMNGEIG